MQFPATDEPAGRNTGTAGYRKTAEYVAQEFERAGLDLNGKIIVPISGGRREIRAALLARYRTTQARAPFLTKAGVIGTISVPNPKDTDVRWEQSKLARMMPSIVLADPAIQERPNRHITLQVNPASMDQLLAGSGRTALEYLSCVRSPMSTHRCSTSP